MLFPDRHAICHWHGLCEFCWIPADLESKSAVKSEKSKAGKLSWWDALAYRSSWFRPRYIAGFGVPLDVVMLGVADGEVGYSGQMLAVILVHWGLHCAFSFLNDGQVKSSSLIRIFCLSVFLHRLLIYIISLFPSWRYPEDLTLPTAVTYQLNVILKLEGSWEPDTLV